MVLCRPRQQAEAALARLTALLTELGVEPKAAKIVKLPELPHFSDLEPLREIESCRSE